MRVLDNFASRWYPSENTSYYDGFVLFAYLVARAATVGVKYGLYGDMDKGAIVGIRSKHYGATGRLDKNLMSEAIFNLHNKQMSVLAEQLYTSCLKRDCDLGCAMISFQSTEHARQMLRAVSDILKILQRTDEEENEGSARLGFQLTPHPQRR